MPWTALPARRSLLAIAAVAVIGACQGSSGASGSPAPGSEALKVAISSAGCAPASLTAPAGRIAFAVTNTGADSGEFEVLNGDRVMHEVENIFPGVTVNTAAVLDGGTYQMVCGTPQAPHGTLTVTGGAAASATPIAAVDP